MKTTFPPIYESRERYGALWLTRGFPRPPVKGPVIIPNGAMVRFKYTLAGQPISNVLHGSIVTGPVATTVAEQIMQSLLSNAAWTAWLPKVTPGLVFVGVEVKDLRTPFQPTLVNTTLTAIPGTSAGGLPSAGAALVITEHTAFSGKGFFGRVYLAGITIDSYGDARHFLTTINGPAMGLVNAYHTAMSVGSITWGIGQRALQANTTPGAPPNLAVSRAASIIPGTNSVVADQRIDSQRRRLGKR